MEFTVDTNDYNVSEFYDAFAQDLPKIVMVNQGFYAEISADTFDRGQILRFHTVSQQPRVIAKTQIQGQEKYFSIPLSYNTNFCVVKHGKAGKEMSLTRLTRECHLPCKVQFSKHQCVDIGDHTVHTDTLPTLELTRVFNEVYLLGNFIVNGVLDPQVVNVPLYLSQLRFALVTGIVGQIDQRWKGYQDELSRSTCYLEFNQEFGHPDIAEYKPMRIESISDYADLATTEPAVYTNLTTIFQADGISRSKLPRVEFTDAASTKPYSTFKNALESTLAKGIEKPQTDYLLNISKSNKQKQSPRQSPHQSPKLHRGHTVCPSPLPSREVKPSPKFYRKFQQKSPENLYENNVGQVSPVIRSVERRAAIHAAANQDTQRKDMQEKTPKLINTSSQENLFQQDQAYMESHLHERSREATTTLLKNVLESTLTKSTPNPIMIHQHTDLDDCDLPEDDNIYEEINPDGYSATTVKKMLNLMKNTKKPQTKPPTAPKPHKPPKSMPQHNEQLVHPPPLPSREAKPSPKFNRKPQQTPFENHYENNVGQVSPIVKYVARRETVHRDVKPETSGRDKPEKILKLNITSLQENPIRRASLCDTEIEKLSVDEVGKSLQALKLDQYIQAFRENMVDGRLLKEFDKDLLKNEFQMSAMETLRMMTFIEEGHIPS